MTRPIHRRAVLAGATLAIAAPGSVVASDCSVLIATCRKIRSFHKEHVRLLCAESAIEDDTPEHAAAMRATDAASEAFVKYADELLAKPVRTWDDVVIRAELVRTHGNFESPPGAGDSYYDDVLSGSDRESRMLRALLAAVLKVSGIERAAHV